MADLITSAHAGTKPAKSTTKSKKALTANRSQMHIEAESQLANALFEQLPYSQLPPEEMSRPVIFAKFIDSLAKLNSCREELVSLGFSLGRASISYDSPPNYAVRVDTEKRVTGQYLIHLDAPVNNAGAHLGALPAEEIREYLTPVLADACRKLIEQFFDGLMALVGRELIGMADWPSEIAIKYWYCRHRVSTQASVTTRTSKVTASRRDSVSGQLWLKNTIQHRRTDHTPTTITREVHHHDAIEANSCRIEAATVVIPENVKQLITAIPIWMRPSIRVADGYMIRTRVDQKQTISTSVITQVNEYEEETTVFLHGVDPALLLGNLVLVGWGPDEIEQECDAERERQVVSQCVSGAAYWGSGAFLIQVLLLLFSSKFLLHPVGVILVMLAFASSVFCFARCIGYAFRAKSLQSKELDLQLTVAGPVLMCGGLQVLALRGSLLWPIMGFTLLSLGSYLTYKSTFYRSL